MKILYTIPNNVKRYYSIMGWINILSNWGHQCISWDKKSKPAYDMFDEHNPDLLIMFVNDYDISIFNCLFEKPFIRTIFLYDNLETTNKKSTELLQKSQEKFQCPEAFVKNRPLLDTVLFSEAKNIPEIESDIACVEMSENPDDIKYLDYLSDRRDLNIKIFDNKILHYPQWIGSISYENIKFVLQSAKIVLIFNEGDILLQAMRAECVCLTTIPDYDGTIYIQSLENLRDRIKEIINGKFELFDKDLHFDSYRSQVIQTFKEMELESETGNST